MRDFLILACGTAIGVSATLDTLDKLPAPIALSITVVATIAFALIRRTRA